MIDPVVRRRRTQPSPEACERRFLLATYSVTNVLDSGPGSLRQAIESVDGDPSPDMIRFDIGGGGSQRIQPATALPAITRAVLIDGATQPGSGGTPLIVIDGTNAGPFSNGLTIQSEGLTVQSLAIVNFGGSGIFIQGGGDVVRSNDVGFDPQTSRLAPNGQSGISLFFASGDVIGEPGAGNLIAGNRSNGITLSFLSSNNLIQGNAIGASTTAASGIGLGPRNIGNDGDGISLEGVMSNTIGGTAAGAGNLISGNAGQGVHVVSGSATSIEGNTIGTDQAGEVAVPNGADGILVEQSPDNTIGGSTQGAGNLVSGNVGRGIEINQAASTRNLIQGNTFGIDANGTKRLANAFSGVYLLDAPGNTIGGPSAGNLISGNGGNGIYVQGVTASGNLIAGNLIGTNQTDSQDGSKFGNAFDGVDIQDAPGNTVGGTAFGAGNIIVLNQGSGIHIQGGGASANLAVGNHIGTDLTADSFLGNFQRGVNIESAGFNTIGGVTPAARNFIVSSQVDAIDIQTTDADAAGNPIPADFNLVEGNDLGISLDLNGNQIPLQNVGDGVFIVASNNTIGGTAAGAGNVISENQAIGITVGSLQSQVGVIRATGNVIQGNIIGLDNTGTVQAGNGRDGIQLIGAFDSTIGGTSAGAGNVISGNTTGLEIFSPNNGPNEILGDVVEGNIIGLGSDGQQLDALTAGFAAVRNTSDGIVVEQGAEGVTIGGTSAGACNVISGNGSSGIRFASESSGDLVEGNIIGLAMDGATARPNDQSGVFVSEASTGITIGGTVSGARNVISGNSIGVTITNPGTSGNLVEGNTIGLAAHGSTAVGNLGYGVLLLDGVTGNTVGGASAGAVNVISANGQGVGIIGPGSSGNLVAGNIVGLDPTGSLARGNLQLGVFLNAAVGNTVGGTSAGAGNVISGNTGVGLEIFSRDSTGNLVVGNLVGLDASGSRTSDATGGSLGNAGAGILIQDSPGNTIGGQTPGASNVVSGNRQAGIDVAGPQSAFDLVEGNDVGLDVTGTNHLGNLGDGILVDNAPANLIGGATTAGRNVVSANLGNGIEVSGSGSFFDQVVGNFIGTDASGTLARGNGQSGIFVNAAPGVVVGGTFASLRNLISANFGNGVRVLGSQSVGGQVLGNFIGTDVSGTVAMGNGNDGVLLDQAIGVTVGGTSPGSTNLISANAASGVEFGGSSTAFDTLQGNLIGTDIGGTAALGNATGVYINASPFDQIGGALPLAGNLISGNIGPGVYLASGTAKYDAVQGNRIGTDLAGLSPLANSAGVYINGSSDNLIGGASVGDSNLISGNTSAGVVINGTAATGNIVQGDLIGPDSTGTRTIRPGSPQMSGILINDAPGNVVGGTVARARNVLSGDVVGVNISGFNAQGNLVVGNFIGLDASGRFAVPDQVGVYINGASSNTIGGTATGSANVISGSSATGVDLYGLQTTTNLVEGNMVGTDASGDFAVPNATGVYVEIATSNTIGGPTTAAGNLISGNSVAGVYFFNGASGNLVQKNRIGIASNGKRLGNVQYGVLLFNAANNTVDKSTTTGNLIANSGIGNFREFTGTTTTNSTPTTTTTITTGKTLTKASHPTGPKVSAKGVSPRGSAAGSASTHRTGR